MPTWNRAVMPAERGLKATLGVLLGSGLAIGAASATEEATAMAAEETDPGMELLEYLGMWEETDEEWLLFDQPDAEEAGDAVDAEAEAPEPVETEDER